MNLELNKIYNADCLDPVEGMARLPDSSVDMILCDLPYGGIVENTNGKTWDVTLDHELLFEQYLRVLKDYHVIVLTGRNPFSAQLVFQFQKYYKYQWIWIKEKGTDFVHSKNKPINKYEDVLIFSNGAILHKGQSEKRINYYPQGLKKIKNPVKKIDKKNRQSVMGCRPSQENGYISEYTNYPTNILEFSRDKEKIHPTQKPVELFEYLIKTYTKEGETILDNCMGSGTTAIACMRTNRNYIGWEKDPEYYEVIQKRISDEQKELAKKWF